MSVEHFTSLPGGALVRSIATEGKAPGLPPLVHFPSDTAAHSAWQWLIARAEAKGLDARFLWLGELPAKSGPDAL